MRINWKFSFFILATLSIIAANGYVWVVHIFINKDIDYRYQPASPAELYYPKESPTITGFSHPARDMMAVYLSPSPPAQSTWKIFVDGQPTKAISGPAPTISLRKTVHDYHIRYSPADIDNTFALNDFTLKIDYFPQELYAKHNAGFSDSYRIVSSTLPINTDKKHSVETFVNKAFSANDVIEAQKIINGEIGLVDTDSSQQKIEKIGLFLYSKLFDKQGIPSKELSRSPLKQYTLASSGQATIWCAQMSTIFCFFANVAGIPTRLVNLGGKLDSVALSAHTFVESYLKELHQWVYIDPSQGILFVRDGSGSILTALDLFLLRKNSAVENMSATVMDNHQLKEISYREVAEKIDFYFNRDATLIYQRKFSDQWGLLRKPALALKTIFNPDYSFSLKNTGNKHLITIWLFYLLLVILLIWILLLFRWTIRYIFNLPTRSNQFIRKVR